MTAEEKGRAFLNYVAVHGDRLRRNLLKNVTYNAEIFEDAFQDTILRVYDSILRNSADIDDYERYFYQASRWRYIRLIRQVTAAAGQGPGPSISGELSHSTGDPPEGAGVYPKEEQEGEPDELGSVKDLLRERFGDERLGMIIGYASMKAARPRASYGDYAARIGVPRGRLIRTVRQAREYLDERLKRKQHGMDKEE